MRSWLPFGLGLFAAVALVTSSGYAFTAGDATRGARIFNKCRACHSLEPGKNMLGPSLAGIVGRPSGSAPDYPYSAGLRALKIVWTEVNLDNWLAGPKAMFDNTKMTFLGMPDVKERIDLITFLRTK